MGRKNFWTSIATATALLLLILDSKTAMTGASDAVKLCLYTIVPSLFPFIVLSGVLNRSLMGTNFKILQPVSRTCGIPRGSESLLLLGFLGGYPVGAQSINDACERGVLSKRDGSRMLAFCNNAGPAFIFGMLGSLFDNKWVPWVLWAIHILSALTVGCILPHSERRPCVIAGQQQPSAQQAVEKAIRIMAILCGWVMLFRVISAFLQRWCLWLFFNEVRIAIIGTLELANGCCELSSLTTQGSRFLLSAVFLGFGGICVTMQTLSVARSLDVRLYFPGKMLQAIISLLLAGMMQNYLFPVKQRCTAPVTVYLTASALGIILLFALRKRKNSSILEHIDV